MQKVALILAGIGAPQKFKTTVDFTHLRVMPGGNVVCPHLHGLIEKRLEFDFGVAKDVGVRGAACGILPQEVGKHPFFVLFGEVDGFQINADDVRGACGINEILAARTVFAVVIVLPVFHKEAGDVVTLLLQKVGGNGAVHAPAHANDDVAHDVSKKRLKGNEEL